MKRQLLSVTRSGRPTRYFIDGKRVSFEAYEDIKAGQTLDTFVTKIDGPILRQYCTVTIAPLSP